MVLSLLSGCTSLCCKNFITSMFVSDNLGDSHGDLEVHIVLKICFIIEVKVDNGSSRRHLVDTILVGI